MLVFFFIWGKRLSAGAWSWYWIKKKKKTKIIDQSQIANVIIYFWRNTSDG